MTARRRAFGAVSAVLLAAALAFAAWRIWSNRAGILESFESAAWDPDPAALAASAILLFAGLALIPAGWILFSRDLGAGTPAGKLAAAWFASQLGRYIPGKIWLFAGRIGFLRSEGLSMARSAAAAVWEVLASFAAVGLVAMPAVLLAGGDLPGSLRTAALAGSAALLLLPLLSPVQRLAFRLKGAGDFTGVRFATSLRAVGAYAASWVLRGASVWLWITGMGLPAKGFWSAVAAAPLSWLAGYIVVFVPGGIGVREAATAAMCDGGSGLAPVMAAVFGQTLLMALFEIAMALATLRYAAPKGRGERRGLQAF